MSLGTGRLRRARREMDQSPIAELANMADLMLVLACGLLLALVINWNVDLARDVDLIALDQGAEVTEGNIGDPAEGAAYEELGVVYRDPNTGKLYMVINE